MSAWLIDSLERGFAFIKRHYLLFNRISGGFLVIIGILIMTGKFGSFLALFSS
jgi:cytochrome c-type biogenesis protein